MNVFVFDIETVPDVKTGARLFGLGDLDSRDVAEIMFRDSLQRTGSEFLRHHLSSCRIDLLSGERWGRLVRVGGRPH